MYDGATATAEAVLMAISATRRRQVVLAGHLHPYYRRVINTYTQGLDIELRMEGAGREGVVDPAGLDGNIGLAHLDGDIRHRFDYNIVSFQVIVVGNLL